MVKPGGLMFVATLNRTAKSFALAIVGAEYILRWLPRGTHQWDKFVTPDELEIAIEQGGLRIIDETGVIYNLFADRWQLSADMDVNYMVVAEKAGVMVTPWLWAVFTVIAAFAQTLTQRDAARADREPRHRRRDPCAVSVRLSVRAGFSGRRDDGNGAPLPKPGLIFWPWAIVGACAQVAATALMLAAMGERSFVVTIAYIKTEPIQVAVFGLVFLGDVLTWPMMIGDPRRHRRRGDHVDQAGRHGRGHQADADRSCFRRNVRALRDRLSRRHSQPRTRPTTSWRRRSRLPSASPCRRCCCRFISACAVLR